MLVKKLFFSFVLLVACANASEQEHVLSLMKELSEVEDPNREEEILTELWSFTGEGSEVSLSLRVVDSRGEMVANRLNEAMPPVEATLRLTGEQWSESITFTPLDYENLYVLLNE